MRRKEKKNKKHLTIKQDCVKYNHKLFKKRFGGEKVMAVKTITSENFEAEVLNAKEPVLVDIWAPWCGPCKMLSPIVDEVAEEADGFSVAKINADENPDLVNKFHVMSIPTLLVFKNGEVVNKSVGLITKDEVKALLA